MSKRILLWIATAIVVVVAAVPQLIPQTSTQTAPSAVPPTPAAPGRIHGIVVREGTANPIAGVVVTVNVPTNGNRGANNNANPAPATPSPDPYTTKTDSAGQFSFDDVPPGTRTVSATLDGYFGRQQNGNVTSVDRTPAVVVSQQTTTIKMELIPAGVISGRIYDSDGMPISDVQVQAMRLVYQEGVRVLQNAGSKSTDDRGEYRIFKLPPGDYYVAATPRSTAPTRNSAGVALPVKTFFPDVTDSARAVPMKIMGGEELSGTNISIRSERGATLSGQISTLLPASGQIIFNGGAVREYNVTNSTLIITPHNRNDLSLFSNTSQVSMAAPNLGKFQVRNVPPGTYDLFATFPDPTGYGSQAGPGNASSPVGYGRATVDVHGGDVEGISLTVHAGVDVKGRITVNGGSQYAQNVRLSLQSDDSASNLPVYEQVSQYQLVVDENGDFRYPSVPEGKYRVEVTYADGPVVPAARGARGNRGAQGDNQGARGNRGGRGRGEVAAAPPPLSPATAFIEDIRQGGISVFDNGLRVGAQSAGDIEVKIGTGPGIIQGTLVGVDQKPAQTTVVLVPAPNRRQNFTLYRTTSSDVNGKFTINGITPGEYQLFAWQDFVAGAYQNAQYMSQYEGRGTIVNVPRSATVTAQARVIPSEK